MLALGVVLDPAIAGAEPSAGCGEPPNLDDGWKVATPAQGTLEALDPSPICAIGPRLEGLKDADPHGVVVISHGALVYEAYFTGEDQRWPEQHWGEPLTPTPHDARTKHDLQSITKSVVALLAGIALDRGSLKSIDTPVLSLFPEYADLRTPDKDRITVRDLLIMTTGLQWPWKPYLSMARQMDAAPDPYRFVLEQPLVAVPGKDWHYNNGSVEVLSAVVQKATARPLDQFAKEALFDPLDIEDWEWGKMANGDPGASWGLRLRPRDLAKIGQLVLNKGTWQGQPIVSSAWIEEMIAPRIVRQAGAYGYLWWLGRQAVDDREVDVINGSGWGGQNLYVVPSLDLVVVVTAGVYRFDGQGPQELASDTALDMVLHAAIDRLPHE
jgi:CubicO group peptidase (beta-lactamase class C family)